MIQKLKTRECKVAVEAATGPRCRENTVGGEIVIVYALHTQGVEKKVSLSSVMKRRRWRIVEVEVEVEVDGMRGDGSGDFSPWNLQGLDFTSIFWLLPWLMGGGRWASITVSQADVERSISLGGAGD